MNIRVQNEDETKKIKKPFFTLTRKNQKGQVAIFVALIFQIVFIFFALLINVGLLVHHKINLQQSTDLAAYYGAMKQAEMLNVVAHVNFQIRQAWKLLTWRYRILGTFGMYNSGTGVNKITLPIGDLLGPTKYNQIESKCTTGSANGYNLNDVPAFCLAHTGYKDWSGAGTETYCKLGCDTLDSGISNVVNAISGTGSFQWGFANVGKSIDTTIKTANGSINKNCTDSTVMTVSLLARFIKSYLEDVQNKKAAINLLLSNLTNSKNNFIDLNGQLVSTGALNTLKNNLTEGNLTGLSNTVEIINGTSDDFSAGQSCQFSTNTTNSELVADIAFKYIIFYQLACKGSAAGSKDFQFVPIVDPQNGLNTIIAAQLKIKGIAPSDIEAIFGQSNAFTLGYEKNPWCMSYYGVRATSEPKIPFLPISKIKLNAISFAKPFGGSIGPMFYKNWPETVSTSQRVEGDQSLRIDKTAPLRNPAGASKSLAGAKDVILNFSNFVGDTLGLADNKYIATYHDFLLASNTLGSGGNNRPAFEKWNNISEDFKTSTAYDPLANDISANNSVRNLEISVVAPNQFDLTYYSIDSDFYNNYYLNKLDNNTNSSGKKTVDELVTKVTGASANQIIFLPDYGYNKNTSLTFNVLDQLRTVDKIIRQATTFATPAVDKTFTFIPASPASLLTGWTFLNLTNSDGYKNFPDEASGTTMPFGICKDSGKANEDYRSIVDPNANPKLPPNPGNCVTGGRTGYSVKIVSQEAINGKQKGIGGPNTEGQIRNPIPDTFLNF